AQRMDRGRAAVGARRGEAVSGRLVAGGWRGAHRIVHRRRPAVVVDRLSRAGSAAAPGECNMKRLALLLLPLLAHAAAAQAPRDFAYGVALSTEGDYAFYQVELPPAVYAGTVRGDLG